MDGFSSSSMNSSRRKATAPASLHLDTSRLEAEERQPLLLSARTPLSVTIDQPSTPSIAQRAYLSHPVTVRYPCSSARDTWLADKTQSPQSRITTLSLSHRRANQPSMQNPAPLRPSLLSNLASNCLSTKYTQTVYPPSSLHASSALLCSLSSGLASDVVRQGTRRRSEIGTDPSCGNPNNSSKIPHTMLRIVAMPSKTRP